MDTVQVGVDNNTIFIAGPTLSQCLLYNNTVHITIEVRLKGTSVNTVEGLTAPLKRNVKVGSNVIP